MAGPLESIETTIIDWLHRALVAVGLAFGGGQAAASDVLTELQQDTFANHRVKVLTPDTLAALVVKGAITHDEGAGEAAFSGINFDRFDAMVRGTGNPPGPETLVDMVRRRIIDTDRAAVGMRQGYLKNEWIPQVLALQHDPLSAAEAVAAAVQGHMSYEAAQDAALIRGVDAEEFRILYDTAGNPPGPMQMLTMLNRGIMDRAEVEQGLRESRLKNKYIDQVLQLAERKVPMRTITTLLGHNAIDEGRAAQMLQQLGYSADDAQAIIASARHTATAPHKEATLAQVRQLYTERIITRDEAVQDLTAAGYEPATANLIIRLADSQAVQKLRNAAVGKIHSLFYAHHLTVDEARDRLAKLAVPSDQVDYMLQLWQLEEEANVHELTPTQVVAAGKKKLLTTEQVVARLVRFGYHEDDATILAMLGGAIPLPEQPSPT